MVTSASLMKYFMTGGPANTNPFNSIGGFVSSTEVPNTGFDNLFGDITTQAAIAGDVSYRCIAIANTAPLGTGGENNYWDGQLWVENDPNGWISIGLEVPLNAGLEGGLDLFPAQFPAQTVQDEHSAPPGVDFFTTCNPWTTSGKPNACTWISIGTFQIPITIIFPPPTPNRTGSTMPGGFLQYFWLRRTIPPGTPPTAQYTFTLRSVGLTEPGSHALP